MRLPTTSWSLVLAAAQESPQDAGPALARLCETYWFPLYAYLRRKGHSAEAAEDLIQGFFARFLEGNYLNSVDRSRGRFRSLLLACLQHFVSNERDYWNAKKRSGSAAPLSLDVELAEGRLRMEVAETRTPEHIYERAWAGALLDRVLLNLRKEWAASGKEQQFDELKGLLTGHAATSQREVAVRLGMGEGAVRVALHRLRKRFREALKEEVSTTVADVAEIEPELRFLFEALSR